MSVLAQAVSRAIAEMKKSSSRTAKQKYPTDVSQQPTDTVSVDTSTVDVRSDTTTSTAEEKKPMAKKPTRRGRKAGPRRSARRTSAPKRTARRATNGSGEKFPVLDVNKRISAEVIKAGLKALLADSTLNEASRAEAETLVGRIDSRLNR